MAYEFFHKCSYDARGSDVYFPGLQLAAKYCAIFWRGNGCNVALHLINEHDFENYRRQLPGRPHLVAGLVLLLVFLTRYAGFFFEIRHPKVGCYSKDLNPEFM